MEIECGIYGKPAYVRRPLDTDTKQAQVIAQLEKTAGPGNYIFIGDDEFEDGEDDLDESVFDTYQLKIQLNNVKNPPVWRRIKIPSEFSFMNFTRLSNWLLGGTIRTFLCFLTEVLALLL